MVQLLKREPIEYKEIVRLSRLTDLQLSKTANDNYQSLIELRINSLADYDGLSDEEIKDIQEYRIDSKDTKQFSNAEDLIADLNG